MNGLRVRASLLLLCSNVYADDSPEIVLADPATQDVQHDPQFWRQFMERSQKASEEAHSRCAEQGKVAMAAAWQNSALQLVVKYTCVSRDAPHYQAAQRVEEYVTAAAFEQAEKVCAAQGKKTQEYGLNMLTFYACVSPSNAVAKPPENTKPQ